MVASHLVTGKTGEDAAATYLKEMGYTIVHRNWRMKQLELDIICTKGNELIFGEVKTRSNTGMDIAINALSTSKISKLSRAAQLFISQNNLWDTPCRFDFLAVTRNGNTYQVEHIKDAFDLSQPMGGGDTTWQPW